MAEESKSTYDVQLEELKYKAEAFKQQYDFFKHMTTLNTSTILIIVALMQYVFKKPSVVYFVIASILFTFGCLICSVIQMFLYSGVFKKIYYWEFWSELKVNAEEIESFKKRTKNLNIAGSILYGLGIISLMIFAIINALLNVSVVNT